MEQTRIDVTVSPRSSRRKVVVQDDGTVRVYLNAPPVEGKANAECVELIASALDLPKSSVSIERGQQGRRKRLLVQGMGFERAMEKLRGGDE
jgi:uncharacterized protein (TIGR00251 family)